MVAPCHICLLSDAAGQWLPGQICVISCKNLIACCHWYLCHRLPASYLILKGYCICDECSVLWELLTELRLAEISWLFFMLGKIGFNGKRNSFCGFLWNLLNPVEKNEKGKM